ncbi:hypothetical protein D3C85_1687590 [compost metagenome]
MLAFAVKEATTKGLVGIQDTVGLRQLDIEFDVHGVELFWPIQADAEDASTSLDSDFGGHW